MTKAICVTRRGALQGAVAAATACATEGAGMADELPPWRRYAPPGSGATAAELEHGEISEADGWRRYNAAIEEVRELILTSPLTNHDPQTRAEALAILPQIQAQAYLLAVAPRQDYPRFYLHEYFDPSIFSYNLPNPDFVYRTAFLDGRRSYRIVGRRGDCAWVNFQAFNSFSGVGNTSPRALGNWDIDGFGNDVNGELKIFVGGPQRARNWIPLDPESRNNWLLVRHLVYEGQSLPPLRIEAVDGLRPDTMILSEGELGRRLALGGEIVKYIVTRMTYARVQEVVLREAGGTNAFHTVVDRDEKEAKDGASPLAAYQIAVYEIEPDDALIFEVTPPSSRYWSVQLGDILNQTRDFVHHATHLNDRTAVSDADGRVRIVLCSGDPGTSNWLDAMGSVFGRLVWRWYGAEHVETPTIRRVKRADVRQYLPTESRGVTATERGAQLRRRRDFHAGLYGF
jgi:hypothetical protein